MSQFVIKFQKNNQVRYAINKTQGNPEYNGIDVGTLEEAKIWKTERGAKNYLENHILIGRQGERLRARWTFIEVVEVHQVQQNQSINNAGNHTMNIETIASTLLSEIADIEETLAIIKKRIKSGGELGIHANVDTSRINNLIGKYQLLMDANNSKKDD